MVSIDKVLLKICRFLVFKREEQAPPLPDCAIFYGFHSPSVQETEIPFGMDASAFFTASNSFFVPSNMIFFKAEQPAKGVPSSSSSEEGSERLLMDSQ